MPLIVGLHNAGNHRTEFRVELDIPDGLDLTQAKSRV